MTALVNGMFDTNIFNCILDDRVRLDDFTGRVVAYATHIQRDEINKTSDIGRREALLRVFREAVTTSTPTASFVLDVSRLDEACLGGHEDDVYSALKRDLDQLNGGKDNNVQDALIAETSIKRGFFLVTDDRDLSTVARKYGGKCLSVSELLAQLKGTLAT